MNIRSITINTFKEEKSPTPVHNQNTTTEQHIQKSKLAGIEFRKLYILPDTKHVKDY